MFIRIDGDACPSINKIIALGLKYSVPVHVYCDFSHVIENEDAFIHAVDSSYQSVDMVMSNEVSHGDFVITQDYGLAQIMLSFGCVVCDPKGRLYTDENIDGLLYQRHCFRKLPKNVHRKGPKKRTREDEENLLRTIERWLLDVNKTENGFKNEE